VVLATPGGVMKQLYLPQYMEWAWKEWRVTFYKADRLGLRHEAMLLFPYDNASYKTIDEQRQKLEVLIEEKEEANVHNTKQQA
jgi:hypothetical protein